MGKCWGWRWHLWWSGNSLPHLYEKISVLILFSSMSNYCEDWGEGYRVGETRLNVTLYTFHKSLINNWTVVWIRIQSDQYLTFLSDPDWDTGTGPHQEHADLVLDPVGSATFLSDPDSDTGTGPHQANTGQIWIRIQSDQQYFCRIRIGMPVRKVLIRHKPDRSGSGSSRISNVPVGSRFGYRYGSSSGIYR
jgi:hypothetical protein